MRDPWDWRAWPECADSRPECWECSGTPCRSTTGPQPLYSQPLNQKGCGDGERSLRGSLPVPHPPLSVAPNAPSFYPSTPHPCSPLLLSIQICFQDGKLGLPLTCRGLCPLQSSILPFILCSLSTCTRSQARFHLSLAE